MCDHDENAKILEEWNRAEDWQPRDDKVVGPCTVKLQVDADEQNADQKYGALSAALNLVQQETRLHLDLLHLYLSPNTRCIAFMGEDRNARVYHMFLGDLMLEKNAMLHSAKKSGVAGGMGKVRGVADQQYDKERKWRINPKRMYRAAKGKYQAKKVEAKAEAVVVHEMGHILHEMTNNGVFWDIKTRKAVDPEFRTGDEKPINAPYQLAAQVSEYASTGNVEFVAEVFTGLVYRKRYSDDVIAHYLGEGGPPVRWDRRTHAAV